MPLALIDVLLLTLLAATALNILLRRNLFAAVMLSGIFSLFAASFFVVMDAVDVAFTEAAVGAGISTIIMLATLAITGKSERNARHFQPIPLLVVVLTGAALIYGTLDMPGYGDPEAPIHHHVAPHYTRVSPYETGVPNIVTSVLASYRGYDTLGELTVIFTAGIAVLLLLLRSRGGAKSHGTEGSSS